MLEIQMESTHNGAYIATSLNTKWSLHYWESIISFSIVAQRGSMETANNPGFVKAVSCSPQADGDSFRYLQISPYVWRQHLHNPLNIEKMSQNAQDSTATWTLTSPVLPSVTQKHDAKAQPLFLTPSVLGFALLLRPHLHQWPGMASDNNYTFGSISKINPFLPKLLMVLIFYHNKSNPK